MDENVLTIVQAISYGSVDLLSDLLRSDFRDYLNWQDEAGQTILHYACSIPGCACVQALIDAGADVNASTSPSVGAKSPLHISASRNELDACKALVRHGADLFARDADGNTPLQCAQINNAKETSAHLLDELETRRLKMIDLQSRLSHACDSGDMKMAEAVLNEAESSFIYGIVNEALTDGSILFSKVCEAGLTEMAELLVQYGAGGAIDPVTFNSPLYIAARAGHASTVKLLLTAAARQPRKHVAATSAVCWLASAHYFVKAPDVMYFGRPWNRGAPTALANLCLTCVPVRQPSMNLE